MLNTKISSLPNTLRTIAPQSASTTAPRLARPADTFERTPPRGVPAPAVQLPVDAFEPSASVEDVAHELSKRAKASGREIRYNFNGQDLVARPGDQGSNIVSAWTDAREGTKTIAPGTFAGLHVNEVADRLANRASGTDIAQRYVFNGVALTARPGQTPAEILKGTPFAGGTEEIPAGTFAGSSIDEVKAELARRAERFGQTQVYSFNGQELRAAPDRSLAPIQAGLLQLARGV